MKNPIKWKSWKVLKITVKEEQNHCMVACFSGSFYFKDKVQSIPQMLEILENPEDRETSATEKLGGCI